MKFLKRCELSLELTFMEKLAVLFVLGKVSSSHFLWHR